MRRVRTRVLPEPAPARMRRGAASVVTASRWPGFSPSSSARAAPSIITAIVQRGCDSDRERDAGPFAVPRREPAYARDVAFPRKLLNDGEEVVLDLRPHWWFLSEPTAALVGALVLLAIVLNKA